MKTKTILEQIRCDLKRSNELRIMEAEMIRELLKINNAQQEVIINNQKTKL